MGHSNKLSVINVDVNRMSTVKYNIPANPRSEKKAKVEIGSGVDQIGSRMVDLGNRILQLVAYVQ